VGQGVLRGQQVVAHAGVERRQQPVLVIGQRPRGEFAGGQPKRLVQGFGDGVAEPRDRAIDGAAQCDQPGHAGQRHRVHSRSNGKWTREQVNANDSHLQQIRSAATRGSSLGPAATHVAGRGSRAIGHAIRVDSSGSGAARDKSRSVCNIFEMFASPT
jgi:hypothetical protein